MKYIIHTIIAILCFTVGLFTCVMCNDIFLSYQLSHPTAEELSYEDSLKVKVLQNGDTIAYNNLKKLMAEKEFPYKIWFYSIVMAKQYYYAPASYDVHKNIDYVYSLRMENAKVDEKTRKMLNLFEITDTSFFKKTQGDCPAGSR